MGRRFGEERKGTWGRDRVARVLCVKGRRELGGRKGRTRSNLCIGSRGRIVWVCSGDGDGNGGLLERSGACFSRAVEVREDSSEHHPISVHVQRVLQRQENTSSRNNAAYGRLILICDVQFSLE